MNKNDWKNWEDPEIEDWSKGEGTADTPMPSYACYPLFCRPISCYPIPCYPRPCFPLVNCCPRPCLPFDEDSRALNDTNTNTNNSTNAQTSSNQPSPLHPPPPTNPPPAPNVTFACYPITIYPPGYCYPIYYHRPCKPRFFYPWNCYPWA